MDLTDYVLEYARTPKSPLVILLDLILVLLVVQMGNLLVACFFHSNAKLFGGRQQKTCDVVSEDGELLRTEIRS